MYGMGETTKFPFPATWQTDASTELNLTAAHQGSISIQQTLPSGHTKSLANPFTVAFTISVKP